MVLKKVKEARFNPFCDFPKNTKSRSQEAGPNILLFKKVKSDLFESLPGGQFVSGWPSVLRKNLKIHLHKADKNNVYEKEINSLKYIIERIYNKMIDKITKPVPKKKKEQWKIDIEEDIRKLNETEDDV